MNRRDWLKRTSLALAGGLVLGDAAMEAYERLTHRKVWALGSVDDTRYLQGIIDRQAPSGVVKMPFGDWKISGVGLKVPASVVVFLGARATYRVRNLNSGSAVLTFAPTDVAHTRLISDIGFMDFADA